MAVNKVIYGGNTLVDLTGDTVTAADLADGVKATGSDGNPIVGLLPKVTIDSSLSATSTNPVQNKVIKTELDTLALTSGELTIPSSKDAYISKLANDALSSINDTVQMTIEQSADGEVWEMLFDSNTATDNYKVTYLNGLHWPQSITIKSGYMARVSLETHTTVYFSSVSLYLKIVCESETSRKNPYKCYAGSNGSYYYELGGSLQTWGSWTNTIFKRASFNSLRYVFNEDKKNDLILLFRGVLCKGTQAFRNVLNFNSNKNRTITSFAVEAPNFIGKVNGFDVKASVPANAKFTDTVYTHPATHPASMITGLSTVATSGSYNDLTDKPNIPASATVDSELSSTSTNPVQNKVIYNALLNKVGTDIYSGFALMGATSTIAWRQGSQPVGSINATNYTGTAARATQDGAGNVITETYATKADVSGVVKSVNGTKPDTDGNVSITVSGGDGVSLSAENTWTGKQTFRKMKFGFESYNAPRISGGTDNPSESVAVYNVQGNFTLDMSVLAGLLNNGDATLFTAHIISNGAYTLSINNAGALKYVGSATDLAITANGLLLNIMLIKSNSGDVSSIVQASKLS